ncbi:hypothetical protein HRbin29_02211 [bacterium HR29]|jgi:hypothetical protein|nr:hypothetical protein HRbin29_02211 [bacterium HR29]
MLTENGVQVDLQAVEEVLRRADVLAIAFTLFPERLLVDTRANAEAGPFAGVVEPVASIQERYLWLGRHRGMFGAPEAFSFFMWPHTVRSLVRRNVLHTLRQRLEAAEPGSGARLDAALDELLQRELEAMKAAVRGDPRRWKTIWERPRGRR